MKSLKILSLSIVIGFCAAVSLAAFEKIPIAVMDFKVTNFQKNESDLFIDFFNNALFETGVFDVLQRNQRDKLLQEIQFSMSDTADAKLTRKVGKLLSSKLLVFGNLGKVGKNVLLSVSMVDVETGRTVSSYSKTYKSLEEVFNSLPEVSSALADPAAESVFMKKTSVLYFDDFEEKKWAVSDKVDYQNGQLQIYSVDRDWYVWQNQIVDDFSIECRTLYVSGNVNSGSGIIFRVQDYKNFYAFFVSPSGYYKVVRYVDGQFLDLVPWIENKSINKKTANLLKVTAFRNHFTFFVNNVRVKEVTDDKFHEGKFGLFSFMGFKAAFDNLIVYQGNLVFYDYFSTPAGNFGEGKVAFTKNGVYNIDGKTLTSPTPFFSWITEPRRNFSFKSDVAFREGDTESAYGIAVRVVDAENNYCFAITKTGYYHFGYYKNSVWNTLVDWKKTRLINSEGINILRVECVDDTFYLYLNENLVETVTDSTFREGGIGFMTASGMNVSFDNAELFLLDQQ